MVFNSIGFGFAENSVSSFKLKYASMKIRFFNVEKEAQSAEHVYQIQFSIYDYGCICTHYCTQ
jgi:hypothetical protein